MGRHACAIAGGVCVLIVSGLIVEAEPPAIATDAFVNYQDLDRFAFGGGFPAALGEARRENPLAPERDFVEGKSHGAVGGKTRSYAHVQGYAATAPPPEFFSGLAASGSAFNPTQWMVTSDTRPDGTPIVIEVAFDIQGRLGVGYVGPAPAGDEIKASVDAAIRDYDTFDAVFQASATLDAADGLKNISGPWGADFVPTATTGIETMAYQLDTTGMGTMNADVGDTVTFEFFLQSLADASEPSGVSATSDFFGTGTYELRALDPNTQEPLPDVAFIPITARDPNVRFTGIERTGAGGLVLTWEGATNDITILHSPVLDPANWQEIETAVSGNDWTLPLPMDPSEHYLLKAGTE